MNIPKLLFISHYFVINLTVLAFETLISFVIDTLGGIHLTEERGL